MIKTHPKSEIIRVSSTSSWSRDNLELSPKNVILQVEHIPDAKFNLLVEYVPRKDFEMVDKEPCEWCEDLKMTGGLFHANGNKLYLDEWSYCPNCGRGL